MLIRYDTNEFETAMSIAAKPVCFVVVGQR
jgi:hypothetical protein